MHAIRAGQIYLVSDQKVSMPPEENRTFHEQRTILVISGNVHNSNNSWPLLTACPISSGSRSSELDIRLGAGIGGLAKKGFARIALVQPFPKNLLGDCLDLKGVPLPLLEDAHRSYIRYLAPFTDY